VFGFTFTDVHPPPFIGSTRLGDTLH
jgi:hypothetical protein